MPINIFVPDHVENEQAYIGAARANIARNARTTWDRTQPRAAEIAEYLANEGRGEFMTKLYNVLKEFGKLSPGQCAIVLQKLETRDAEKAARHVALEGGAYVGTVGQRLDITLTISTRKHDTEPGPWGTKIHRYFFVGKTADDATVIYGGSVELAAAVGDTVTVKATIKEHGQSKGRAQTVIQRPKVI